MGTAKKGGRSSRARDTGLCGVSEGSILESISEGVFTVDEDWKITYFNRAAEESTVYGVQTPLTESQ